MLLAMHWASGHPRLQQQQQQFYNHYTGEWSTWVRCSPS